MSKPKNSLFRKPSGPVSKGEFSPSRVAWANFHRVSTAETLTFPLPLFLSLS